MSAPWRATLVGVFVLSSRKPNSMRQFVVRYTLSSLELRRDTSDHAFVQLCVIIHSRTSNLCSVNKNPSVNKFPILSSMTKSLREYFFFSGFTNRNTRVCFSRDEEFNIVLLIHANRRYYLRVQASTRANGACTGRVSLSHRAS